MMLDAILQRVARSWGRSLAKTITWRLFATVDTFVISILVTGSAKWAGSIVSVELITKMTLYFLHERAWSWRPARLATVERVRPSAAR